MLREFVDIDLDAAALGDVHHVQRDHHRHVHLQHLDCQIKVAFEVGGIDDVDDDIGFMGEQIVTGDFFIEGAGIERIDARQVDNGDFAIAEVKCAHLAFDGDTRPVTGLLPNACQCIEQCRLAAVGVARQRDLQRARDGCIVSGAIVTGFAHGQ